MVNSIGRSLRWSSWQFVRPRLNSDTQYIIVENEAADLVWEESSSALIFVGLRPFKWKYWIKNSAQFFSFLQRKWNCSLSIAPQNILNNVEVWNFKHVFYKVACFHISDCFQIINDIYIISRPSLESSQNIPIRKTQFNFEFWITKSRLSIRRFSRFLGMHLKSVSLLKFFKCFIQNLQIYLITTFSLHTFVVFCILLNSS